MANPLNEFHYWQSATDKAAVAHDQANRHTPDTLGPPFHKGSPAVKALTSSERKEMAAWYSALAKASSSRDHAARFKGFSQTLAKFKS